MHCTLFKTVLILNSLRLRRNTCAARPTISAQATNPSFKTHIQSEDEYKLLDDELWTLATAVRARVETVPKHNELSTYASHFGKLHDPTRGERWPDCLRRDTSVVLCVPTARETLTPKCTLRPGTPPHSATVDDHVTFDPDCNLSEYLMSLLQPDITQAIAEVFTNDVWSAGQSRPSFPSTNETFEVRSTSLASLPFTTMTTSQSPNAAR
jgi:hypothetical protein